MSMSMSSTEDGTVVAAEGVRDGSYSWWRLEIEQGKVDMVDSRQGLSRRQGGATLHSIFWTRRMAKMLAGATKAMMDKEVTDAKTGRQSRWTVEPTRIARIE